MPGPVQQRVGEEKRQNKKLYSLSITGGQLKPPTHFFFGGVRFCTSEGLHYLYILCEYFQALNNTVMKKKKLFKTTWQTLQVTFLAASWSMINQYISYVFPTTCLWRFKMEIFIPVSAFIEHTVFSRCIFHALQNVQPLLWCTTSDNSNSLCLTWGRDVAQLVRAWDHHAADTGSIPWCSKGFSSQSQLSVQTLSVSIDPCVRLHALTSVWTIKSL